MGVCASCLGLGRRESHDSEAARLLDDELYQPGYGYGALNQAHHLYQPDPEDLKREREALEAICQRTSDAVVDIWALQPQPHLQPRAALPSTSSRAASGETGSVRSTGGSSRPGTGDDAAVIPAQKKVAPVPKHWGEVVIPTRKGKKSRGFETAGNGGDVFGVLKVT
ncbi:hypothetical protein DTO166G4_2921 [Paecilomyces variotii]|nr:hypothetical protein DTO166G4_2921 [Paecilomyces variotii]KAJ9220037.1 hypothetical protein DTO169C6_7583 [Paecilomyces variotii]KAJ9233231.1 hypothetical protein DTO166G5_5819 [Paecilomyces variotii]KAJ9244872.1 hypothetical protein DTO169E5_1253 [Paecilomyces variotii]KAJ9250527.1 hypothetical protein DTO195F2_8108 [Paecilomyces variotii]